MAIALFSRLASPCVAASGKFTEHSASDETPQRLLLLVRLPRACLFVACLLRAGLLVNGLRRCGLLR